MYTYNNTLLYQCTIIIITISNITTILQNYYKYTLGYEFLLTNSSFMVPATCFMALT
jgi:hypothetical protein